MRLKVIAGNLVAVLLLGLVAYSMVRAELTSQISREVHGRIGNDQTVVDQALRLNALEFLNLVVERADSDEVRSVFGALDEEGRRNRAFEAAERSAGWFADPARGMNGAPDIVVVVDDAGKVVARNVDRNRMFGSQLSSELVAMRRSLADGRPRHDVWDKRDTGKMLHYAVAPIASEKGVTLGAFVVGYDLSNGLAKRNGEIIDRDVAFLTEGKVYSSSFSESDAKQLKGYLFGSAKGPTETALGGSTTAPFNTSISGDEYVAVMAPLPMARSAKVAYAVLANRSDALAITSTATKFIPMLTALFAVVVFIYGFMVASSFLRPLERIEEDVLAVINGNTDLRLDTSQGNELGGLAYRINQLVNVFTGVSEGDGDSAGAGGWADSAAFGGESGGGAAARSPAVAANNSGTASPGDVIDDPAVAQRLEAEPDASYYTRLYREYVAAKQAVGESVSNIAEDRFIQRLQGNEAALAKKHGCRKVRFQVKSTGNQVALQPVLIR